MHGSRLEKLWEVPIPLPCLKSMNLCGSCNLKELPDMSNATNLEVLVAGFCTSLVEVPSSIGKATSLQQLHLYCCSNLMYIPSSIGNVTNLETLNLQCCYRLVELPSSVGRLKRLENLLISRCEKLDYRGSRSRSFPNISTNIRRLDLSYSTLEEMPSMIMSCTRLHILIMSSCKGLKVFPNVPDSIRELDLSKTGIEEIPPSIKNLSRLTKLIMYSCKKLKVLPTNMDLVSLSSLDLSHCTLLKTFPEISTSIEYLDLRDTAIEEVPSSIWSWFRLVELSLDDCNNLQVFHIVLDNNNNIQELELELELELSNTETNFLGGDLETVPVDTNHWPLPFRINLNGCKNLVSLPHLPDFVSFLDAAGCESLERIQGYFHNPEICLNFANCFKLSQESKEVIQESDCKFALLPGEEVPAYFDHRARGDSLTVSLDQRPFPSFLRFKACLLLLQGPYISFEEDEDEVDHSTSAKKLSCRILCVHNGDTIGYGYCEFHLPDLLGFREHLYFFESSISLNFPETDLNFSELEFEFKISGEYWAMKGCGVRLLEDPDVHGKESADIKITKNFRAGRMSRRNNCRGYYYYTVVAEEHKDTRRVFGACVLVGFLCIGFLVYKRLEKFLIFLLPILVFAAVVSFRKRYRLCSQVTE